MFEKSLEAMVRDVRENESRVFEALSEIKQELRSSSLPVKTNAILKLGYLSMDGYALEMAHFPIIEVMSAPDQHGSKKAAMFVAALAFREQKNDLKILTANIFQKDLSSTNSPDISVALSCLAQILDRDLAEATFDKVLQLVTFSKPEIRKKTALILFKMVEIVPNFFLAAKPKFEQLLVDPDQSVQTCVVTSLLEICRINPKLVITFIPTLFHLLKETRNNWTRIKLLKIFQFLVPVEARIVGKVMPLVTTLMENNKAKSVEIELIRFAQLCHDEKGNIFATVLPLIDSPDLNIKWLGFSLLRGSEVSLDCESRQRLADTILCNHQDPGIRDIALSQIDSFLDESAEKTIRQLLTLYAGHNNENCYLDAVLRIAENYPERITDTEWYLKILVLLKSSDCRIEKQFRFFAMRNPEIGISIAISLLSACSSPELRSACISIIGELADTKFQPSNVCDLMAKNCSNINDLWNYLKVRLVHSEQQCESMPFPNLKGDIATRQVCAMVLAALKCSDLEYIRSVVFGSPVVAKPPVNLDQVFIQLPKEYY